MSGLRKRSSGEGSIYYSEAHGRWEATVELGRHGVRRRKTFTGKTREAVRQKLIRTQREGVVRNEAPPPAARQTVADLVQRWLADRRRRGVNPRVRVLARFVASSAFAETGVNPFAKIKPPRVPRRRMTVWTEAQALRFLEEAATDRLGVLFTVALATGMRSGELVGLRRADVDLVPGIATVQDQVQEHRGRLLRDVDVKTAAARRQVRLPRVAVDAITAELERQRAQKIISSTYVFCDSAGGTLRARNVYERHFKPIMRRIGLPCERCKKTRDPADHRPPPKRHAEQRKRTPPIIAHAPGCENAFPEIRFHDVRHTFATIALARGVPVKVVSEMLGHASVHITLDLYQHVLPDMQE